MTFRKFLKQWLGYTRRERTGSMVLLVILLVVLVVRTVGVGEKRELSLSRATAEAAGDLGLEVEAEAEAEAEVKVKAKVPKKQSFFVDPRNSKSPFWRKNFGTKASASAEATADRKDRLTWSGSGSGTGRKAADLEIHTSEVPPSKGELIDINRADSAELEALPGIGPVLSVRIIKYRHLIGYYDEIDQLNDVYGLDSAVIEMNRHRFTCDSTLVRKININTAAYRDLLRHPYINRSQVEAIIAYRRLSGSFNDISELTSNRIFTPDELIRLRPYLELK